jgi:hypothetical protein
MVTVTAWVVDTCVEVLVLCLSARETGSAARTAAATTTSPRTRPAFAVEPAALVPLSSPTPRSRPLWTPHLASAWVLPPWVVLQVVVLTAQLATALVVTHPSSMVDLLARTLCLQAWVPRALTLLWAVSTCTTVACNRLHSTAALLRPPSLLPIPTPDKVLPTVATVATIPSPSFRLVSVRCP